jgi:N-acetyl-gamma-glutamylphosphate reductase
MVVPVRAFGPASLKSCLELHPFVAIEAFEEADAMWMEFTTNRPRRVYHGNPSLELYGLTELMDNNPLVCADAASVTGAAASLVMVALGPVAKAALIAEMPAIALNFGPANDEIDTALAGEGWQGGTVVATDDSDPDVMIAECVCEIRLPGGVEDIEALYEECFGRSFFVRPVPRPQAGDAYASYELHVEDHGNGTGLLKAVATASRNGKCGAGALVHMFNVMCGFEESLGVAQ